MKTKPKVSQNCKVSECGRICTYSSCDENGSDSDNYDDDDYDVHYDCFIS